MSARELVSLKTHRIIETEKRIQAAEKDLEVARTSLQTASTKLEIAATDDEKKLAKDELQKASESVAKAEQQVEFYRGELEQLFETKPQTWYSVFPWSTAASFVLFGILGLVVLFKLTAGFENDGLLETLQDIGTARGLITFLITLVTVTIALILALSTIVSNSADRNERFKDGKDLLTILIGILGTIVGFYFGQLKPEGGELRVSPPLIRNETPSVGEELSVAGFVTGGQAPYTCEFVIKPEGVVETVQPFTSENGLINKEIKILNDAAADTEVTLAIKATDSNGLILSSTDGKFTVTSKP